MAKSGSVIGAILGLAGLAGLTTLIVVATRSKAAPGPLPNPGGPGEFTVSVINAPSGSYTFALSFTLPNGVLVMPPLNGEVFDIEGQASIINAPELTGVLTIVTMGQTDIGALNITGIFKSDTVTLTQLQDFVFDCSQYKNQVA